METCLTATLRHLMLATLEDTANPLAWSGSAMEIRRALEGAVEQVTVLDHLPVKKHPAHALVRLAAGGSPARYPLWMTEPALRQFARETARALERHRPQALFCIGTQCLIYLGDYYQGPPLPTFTFSDSPWMAWLELYKGYYPSPIGAARFAAREREAARRCTGMIYGSEWAKRDAVERFDVAPERVHVQPMGAAWVPEEDDEAVRAAVLTRPRDRVELLFVAKEWERKGGPLALAIARGLRDSKRIGELQLQVRLNIVGVRPELAPEDSSLVRMFGMLRRSDPGEAQRLRELLLGSHFLVVPTLAECFGLVFAEAQAFALPPVSRSVHALPSVVLDGETGLLEAKDAGPEPYIERILALLEGDREDYVRMALAGRAHFHDQLNWTVFGAGVKRTIETALAAG